MPKTIQKPGGRVAALWNLKLGRPHEEAARNFPGPWVSWTNPTTGGYGIASFTSMHRYLPPIVQEAAAAILADHINSMADALQAMLAIDDWHDEEIASRATIRRAKTAGRWWNVLR